MCRNAQIKLKAGIFDTTISTMYFTSLPDHTAPEFNEQAHFAKFKKHNIIFNAESRNAHCDSHVGCLSLKTVLRGEEWYGINNHHLAIRPGQFLILNDDQTYSCRIDQGESVRSLSIFFKKEFATSVLHDSLNTEEALLENPFDNGGKALEFFQTLHGIDSTLHKQLQNLITTLNNEGYDSFVVDEYLVFLLNHLIKVHQSDSNHSKKVNAVKPTTKIEVYKRLCIAKDLLHSYYMDKLDLKAISTTACLSVPQLIRQFKLVFQTTPHQYLMRIRLHHAAELLKSKIPVSEITWRCGFENVSAFCRAFKSEYGVQPRNY